MKLIMTKGLPGSGKSTWAKTQNAYRINKDDLRSMMNNGKWSKINEKYILLVRDMIIELHLKDKNNVIVDDTNLAPKHEARLRDLAKKYGAEFEIQDFTHVPIEVCIARDLKRLNSVGEAVIKKMYKDFLQPKPEVVFRDENLPDAIICDLDGTLALFGEKNPYDRDFTKDEVNSIVREILRLHSGDETKIIFVSGRKDVFKDQTEKWLKENWGFPYELHMRKTAPEGQNEPKDVLVKEEIYNEYIKGKYNVLFVLDDRDQVVNFWRSQGLTCLQVAEGNF